MESTAYSENRGKNAIDRFVLSVFRKNQYADPQDLAAELLGKSEY